MFETIARSEEAWGPLAKVNDKVFKELIDQPYAKDAIKEHIKKQKKLKTYKVSFIKQWESDTFEIQAENQYAVERAAAVYFKENESKIGFKEKERSRWADSYRGYDSIRYVKTS